MQIGNWQKIKTERVFQSRFFNVDKDTFKMPDGSLRDFFIKNTGHDVVSIVGITPDNYFILEKQFRPGPEKIFYEFPLGFIENNEKPMKAAEREFLEETGYQGELKDLGIIEYMSAYNKAGIYCFLAQNCRQTTDKPKLDEGEFIKVVLKPLAEVRQMLKTGQIRNFGEGYLALDHLSLL